MPTYEYECQSCGHKFELFQRITEKPQRRCPGCGKSKAKRLIGKGAGIIFRGSGFYQTDYRSDTYHKAAKEDNGASHSADSSKTKPQEKPGAKTEAKSAKKTAAAKE